MRNVIIILLSLIGGILGVYLGIAMIVWFFQLIVAILPILIGIAIVAGVYMAITK